MGTLGYEEVYRLEIVLQDAESLAPLMIVIHEVYGLTDWVRAVADRLAADGFIAIAPDMLSGKEPGNGGTDRFASRDDVVKAVRGVSAAEVVTMLDAVSRYGRSLPAATGKFGVIGFCWGGSPEFSLRCRSTRSGRCRGLLRHISRAGGADYGPRAGSRPLR